MTPTDSTSRPEPARRAAFAACQCDCCTPATQEGKHADGEPPLRASDELDKIVLMLGAITSGTALRCDGMSLTLRDGREVDIWESGNDGGFKWAYSLPPRTDRQP
ncbi:hypothetical protein AB0L82_36035 [Nocardia sp. NPDC052001]|uniref:hypothetical protein n=1 Tax=Nocardia sp. NPDC052001 TaxID=3154853 RepID=UPI00343E27C1